MSAQHTQNHQLDDDPIRIGLESALCLQRLFTCTAETKAARALYNYAGAQIDLCELKESIAIAQNRGHLQSNFYSQLKEWKK